MYVAVQEASLSLTGPGAGRVDFRHTVSASADSDTMRHSDPVKFHLSFA